MIERAREIVCVWEGKASGVRDTLSCCSARGGMIFSFSSSSLYSFSDHRALAQL